MKKVLIMFGGNSPEHNVSVKSVKFILNNINKKKYYYEVIGITKKGEWIKISNTENITDNWEIKEVTNIDNIISYLKKFDIVLPIIHGNTCEDGKIQSMLELFNIKYVGSNSYSSIVSYDKILTKLMLLLLQVHSLHVRYVEEKRKLMIFLRVFCQYQRYIILMK